jgi:hypothetical protein
MDITELWWEGVEWLHLAQIRDQWRGCSERGNETFAFMKVGEFY